MDEEKLPPPPPSTPRIVKPEPDPRGSLGAGFGIGCAILVVGPSFAAAWIGGITQLMASSGYTPMFSAVMAIGWLVPIAALVGFVVHFIRKGKPRTVLGIGAAVLAAIAVALLLLAACAAMLSGL